jgi:hypothetical protein
MTTLVTIGCSHTAGSMIDGKNGTSWFNKQHSFGGLLAKRYGINHYNLGVPGGSNQYIYRSTIRFINNFMHNQDDYIFLIGWTSTNRIELRYPENSSYVHKAIGDFLDTKYVPFTIGTDSRLYHTKELKELDKFCPLIFYENQLESDWAVYAYTLQSIFKNKNLKYYMFNTCHKLPVNNDNRDIVDKLDTDFYYRPTDFDSSMLYWALNQGFEKTSCWHLKADGHAAWAEHLNTLMCQQGIFDNLSQPKVVDKSNRVGIAGKVITLEDIQAINNKYKIEARIILDSMYDKIYLLFSEKETTQSMKIKVNIINKDLIKRFGPSAKIDKFDNQFNQMDDTYVTEHFRKQISA